MTDLNEGAGPGPFAREAPLYWSKGYRVIPLTPGTKEPARGLTGWTGYASSIPSQAKQSDWIETFAHHGIGLLTGTPLGEENILVAIDIDDPRLTRVVEALLPETQCAKKAKKGPTIFARSSHRHNIKSTQLRNSEGEGKIDVLAAGRYTVMPDSIHPDTGRPYEWLSAPLYDLPANLLPLFEYRQFVILKTLIASSYIETILTGQSTHDAGVALVAQLVRHASDEEIIALFRALLPVGYNGDSLIELPGWISSAREKGFDQVDEEGDKVTDHVLRLAEKTGLTLFHDRDIAFATVLKNGGKLTYPVTSHAFSLWLRYQAYTQLRTTIGSTIINDVCRTLEAKALFEGEQHDVAIRVAGKDQAVEIDLGYDDGRIVRITPIGWQETLDSQLRFYRASGFDPLPAPARGGNLQTLRRLLGLDGESFILFLAFLINALKPSGPYLLLIVEGEQGSGKSFLCAVAKMLIDPNRVQRLRMPENERDLMLQAREYRLLVFDNASRINPDMSDFLCSLATGSAIAVRRLYTNDELHATAHCRPFIINGITGYARRPDLLERAIPLKLKPMPEGDRKLEEEMWAEFDRIKPSVLAALYDAVEQSAAGFRQQRRPPNHSHGGRGPMDRGGSAGPGLRPSSHDRHNRYGAGPALRRAG